MAQGSGIIIPTPEEVIYIVAGVPLTDLIGRGEEPHPFGLEELLGLEQIPGSQLLTALYIDRHEQIPRKNIIEVTSTTVDFLDGVVFVKHSSEKHRPYVIPKIPVSTLTLDELSQYSGMIPVVSDILGPHFRSITQSEQQRAIFKETQVIIQTGLTEQLKGKYRIGKVHGYPLSIVFIPLDSSSKVYARFSHPNAPQVSLSKSPGPASTSSIVQDGLDPHLTRYIQEHSDGDLYQLSKEFEERSMQRRKETRGLWTRFMAFMYSGHKNPRNFKSYGIVTKNAEEAAAYAMGYVEALARDLKGENLLQLDPVDEVYYNNIIGRLNADAKNDIQVLAASLREQVPIPEPVRQQIRRDYLAALDEYENPKLAMEKIIGISNSGFYTDWLYNGGVNLPIHEIHSLNSLVGLIEGKSK